MRVDVAPRRAAAPPGEPVIFSVTVTNTGEVISGHRVRVLGLDRRWVRIDKEQFSLFPGATGAALVTLTMPPGVPAGARRIAVQVREVTPPHSTSVVEIDLDVPAARAVDMRLDPVAVTGGRGATFGLVVENVGNTPVAGALGGLDPEEKVRFRFSPPHVDLGPGERAAVEMRLRARRRFAGTPVVRPFQVRVGRDPAAQTDAVTAGGLATAATIATPASDVDPRDRGATGTFIQRPWLSRGALSLAGLLAAVTVFALVITYALSGVVSRSAADRNLALQVAQAQQSTAAAGTSSVAGTVRLLTSGSAVPGVTVEVFTVSDTGKPVTSAATDDKGDYRLGGLPAGSYKLRFRGAGFAELWYPSALTDADATKVDLIAGQAKTGLDVLLGGLPATLSGTVTGDDPVGATVTLETAGASADPNAADASSGESGSGGAILRTVTVAADGGFVLEQVPSPSVYDLVVSKPGYATDVERVDLAGGESRTGVQVVLRKGDGLIAGHVTDATAPLGGATVTASSGQTTVQTVTLTQDDVGAFTLRGLPTPGTFTVVVAKPGLASQTLTLSLTAGQQLTGVGVTLGDASGSLSGVVTTLSDGQPASGVTVTVTNGALTVQTVTESAGTAGAWSVAGLSVPSTYTVTFSRADLAPQTLSVSLDAFGDASGAGGDAIAADDVNASLRSATAVLEGTAHGPDGTALGEIEVALTASDATYKVTTASVPTSRLGQYEIDRLPPGTYTVSVNRRGARPTSTIITLTAGEVHVYDPVLAEPASISGTVTDIDGDPLTGAVVNLYRASQYPSVVDRTTTTDANGRYTFIDVDAPENYIVEFQFPAGSTPHASCTVTANESQALTVNLAQTADPGDTGSSCPAGTP